MSSVTPGRETDAKVAEALGWTLRRIGRGIPPGCEGMKHPVAYPRYSTSPADALAALEAMGEPWGLVYQKGGKYGCNIGPSHTWHYGETLCTAICAAILQLPRGEGKAF